MSAKAEMDRVAFGRKLYAIRREQRITSDRLAELCEVNPNFIRQIERASRLVSLPMLVRICNALCVSPNFFLVDSLLWDSEDEIDALSQKLRALSPRQLRMALGTVNALINEMSESSESEAE